MAPSLRLLCITICFLCVEAESFAHEEDFSRRISFEESIPAFRRNVDGWSVHDGAKGEWSGSGHFTMTALKQLDLVMSYSRFPGMKPFPGAEKIVLETEFDRGILPATAELDLFEFPSGKKMHFCAPLMRNTCFETRLDPSKRYQFGTLGVHRTQGDGKPWTIAFSSFRGIFFKPKAEALHISAETGNPLIIAREECGERPVLRVYNAARERIAAHGVLKMAGFRGDPMDIPVDVALGGGETIDIPLPETLAKGVWRIQGELAADDGSVAKVDTRFAVMDYHGRTPRQPMGTFRLGVLWHIQRYTPHDRALCAAAMVACGAKLTRADVAHMAMIQHGGPECWDFAKTDELLAVLEETGIALDAIIFNTPKWAAAPDRQTNSSWRAWAMSRPATGTFGRFCERLAARYGTRIDYYEIGNEWDLKAFFRGTVDDAVEILREAHDGLRRGCPEVCVIPSGWADVSDSPLVMKSGNPSVREAVLCNAADSFEVAAVHGHCPFPEYVRRIRNGFFPLLTRTGVADKPWFANETALTSVWSERNAALTVWKKILWAWANGSVDYIWYNLKATGWNPKDAEQGYGLLTADFRPRETYVAFAALATVVGGGEFRRTVFEDGSRFCFEFAKEGNLVLTAWDESDSGMEIPVTTDAPRAWRVDLMGNRETLQLSGGNVSLTMSKEPCAIILEGATFASIPEGAFSASKRPPPDAMVIPPDGPGRAPDFVLDRPEQVHDFFEANPAESTRLWKGPEDNSAKVWLAAEKDGLRIRVEVRDDIHCQPFSGADQYLGDDIQVALDWPGLKGHFELGFARLENGTPDVHCWIAPDGFNPAKAAGWVELETWRDGDITRYDAFLPYMPDTCATRETLARGIRFDLMVNDNDGDGRDATLEIVPGSFHSKDMSSASRVRFP